MADDPAISAAPAREAPVPSAVFCVQCGYELVGLFATGKCPECGTPVEFSLRGHLLAYAAPRYLKAIGQGLSCVLWGFAGLFFFSLIVLADSQGQATAVRSPLVLDIVYSLGVLLILLGYVRYTTPDPGYTGREDPASSRRFLRWSSVAMLALAVSAVVMHMLGMPTGLGTLNLLTSPSSTGFAGAIVMALILTSMGVQFFAVLTYTSWLGRRVPDGQLTERARRYRWLLPTLPVLGLLPLTMLFVLKANGAVPGLACCTICTFPLALFVATGMYLSLLIRIRSHVRAILDTGAPAPYPDMTPASEIVW